MDLELAEEEKNLGNKAYKARQFQKAIEHYDKAISIKSTQVLYYNNKAAVFIELNDYQGAMNTVDTALKVYTEAEVKDFVKLAKLFARKAAIYKHLNDFKASIDYYEKSLLEDN